MSDKQCFRCGHYFRKDDAVVHRAYGDYHERCYRELCGKGARMIATSLCLLLMLACSSAPVEKGKHYLQGCTAAMTTMGSIVYERVTVVGITPQGSTYWVYFPDRNAREGKVHADSLPTERFIERGKLGHARGRPCKCPQELWGLSSGFSATD